MEATMLRTLSLCLVMWVGAGCSEDFKGGTESPDDTGRPGSLAFDDDGDGFSEDQGDCDDSNPLISPDEVEEPYNGINDDCDDATGDRDADGDGHDADFAQGGDDCDDTNAAINPSEPETAYNGIDDDCDPETSDLDKDGDGFDAESKGGDDCDDENAAINPGAFEDTTDGIDNNCNDTIDERFSPSFVDFYSFVGERSALGVDSAGQLHVAYQDAAAEQLMYRHRLANGVWEDAEAVAIAGKGSGAYMDGAVDAQDKFQLAFTYGQSGTQRLEYGYRQVDGTWGGWEIVAEKDTPILELFPNVVGAVHSENVGFDVTMDLDSGGLPSFAYYDAGRKEPVLCDFTSFGTAIYAQVDAYYDVGHEVLTGFGMTDGPTGYTPSVAVDQNDMDHVVYWDTSAWDGEYFPPGFDDEAQYSAFTDFDLDKIYFSEEIYQGGSYTSLAIRADNTPCFASQDNFNGDLQYSCFEGGVWSQEVVDATGSVGAYAELGFNSKDEPYIAYYDGSNSALKIAHRSGETWQLITVDSDGLVGKEPSMAISADDRVFVTYYDQTYEALKLAEGR